MAIVLFEDNQCDNMRPTGWFKPYDQLVAGCLNLRSIVDLLDEPVLSIRRDHFLCTGTANDDPSTKSSENILFLNSSLTPDIRYLDTLKDIIKAGDLMMTTSGNRVAAAMLGPGVKYPETLTAGTVSEFLLEQGLPLEDEMFKTIDLPHELVAAHMNVFDVNLEHIIASNGFTEKEPGLFLGEGTTIHPSCAMDTSGGPIIIDDGVTILPFTYMEGPIYIGRKSRIIEHAAIKEQTCIGHTCKVGGEVEFSAIQDYSNKQHHGFLGHSWVGGWVNLGAGTTTSDLKNTYGTIRMDYNGSRVDTGMQFIGSIIGDYVKTAINTSIFTGKLVGLVQHDLRHGHHECAELLQLRTQLRTDHGNQSRPAAHHAAPCLQPTQG